MGRRPREGGRGGYGSSKAALEQLSSVLAVENPELRVYWLDPGDMRTDMQQAAYPGEDISDRPLPEGSVAAVLALLEGEHPGGRHIAREICRMSWRHASRRRHGVCRGMACV